VGVHALRGKNNFSAGVPSRDGELKINRCGAPQYSMVYERIATHMMSEWEEGGYASQEICYSEAEQLTWGWRSSIPRESFA